MIVVWRDTQAENLTGRGPYVIARSQSGLAHLLERRSDGRIFLYLQGRANEEREREWAEGVLDEKRMI